jgi:hypothetical protein
MQKHWKCVQNSDESPLQIVENKKKLLAVTHFVVMHMEHTGHTSWPCTWSVLI